MPQEEVMFFCRDQKCRLVNREFPWLWAIKPTWLTVPKISQNIEFLKSILGSLPNSTDEKLEVWVALGNSWEEVFHVFRAENWIPGACWAQQIISRLVRQSPWYVVLVKPTSWRKDEQFGESATVFRHPKGNEAMSELIDNIAINFGATHREVSHISRQLGGHHRGRRIH